MNIKHALATARSKQIEVTADHTLNGKTYFAVIDKTNDEAVIVDRVSRVFWRPEGMKGSYLRGVAINNAICSLLSRRNK